MVAGERGRAMRPEDLTRLFVERANAGDAEGMAELYTADAVMAYPPGQLTVGRSAMLALFQDMVASRPQFRAEQPLPTLRAGDVALTATPSADGHGTRVQVVVRQSDGSWLRLIDRPEAI